MEAKQIGEVAANVLTSLTEPATKARDTSIAMPPLKGWTTCGDQMLERMQVEAQYFLKDMQLLPGTRPRWLSFVGESGTGKTYLCNIIRELAPVSLRNHMHFRLAGYCVKWPKLIASLRDQDYSIFDEPWSLLFIDDIGASTDTEFAAAQLSRLLNERIDRWTLITSNLNLEDISNKIDTRIASRLVRGRNVCVEVNTVDFALRKK